MTDRIEPVLTAEQWKRALACTSCDGSGTYLYENDPPGTCPSCNGTGRDAEAAFEAWCEDASFTEAPQTIALANAALPDTDPRKITRAKVETLRHMIGADESWTGCSPQSFALAESLLDALESYLPPE
jgi:excinuclease UvrABC ATPase subunit